MRRRGRERSARGDGGQELEEAYLSVGEGAPAVGFSDGERVLRKRRSSARRASAISARHARWRLAEAMVKPDSTSLRRSRHPATARKGKG